MKNALFLNQFSTVVQSLNENIVIGWHWYFVYYRRVISNMNLQLLAVLGIVGTEKVVDYPLFRDEIRCPNIVVLYTVFSH